MDPEQIPDSVPTPVPLRQNPEWRRFFRMHPHLRATVKIIGISAATSLVVIVFVGAVGWTKREKIAALLLATVPNPTPSAALPATIPDAKGSQKITDQPRELSVTEVVSKVNPSVVSIEVSQHVATSNPFGEFFGFSTGQQSSPTPRVVGKGTGFFVSSDGYIVTNRHVVDFDAATYAVTTVSGKKYTANLIAKDPVFDLAVLKVQGSGFPAATLGDSSALQLGQSVVAIGFALGEFQNSISVGVISGLSRSITAGGGGSTEQLDRIIQTDAAINPGNSGGPLINLRGEVIGVNVAVAQGSQNVGFAIPSTNVRQVVNSVKAFGTIVRPYVGISYAQIDENVQKANNLPVAYGIFVNSVLPDTPASRAGIQAEDIILSIDGITLDGTQSFATIIRDKKVGQTVSMKVLREGVQRTVSVTLAKAPSS